MNNLFKYLGPLFGWLISEHIKDYRENNTRIYEAVIKTNTQINQIILTVSVASLAAVAALNKEVFVPYGALSFVVVSLFILVILLSVINLYIASFVMSGFQRQLNENWKSLSHPNKDITDLRFKRTRNTLNTMVFGGFCLGLISFLTLLGFYILRLGL